MIGVTTAVSPLEMLFPRQLFGRTHRVQRQADEAPVYDWNPPIDIAESPEGLTFILDVPGLGKDDVSVTVDGNTLVLTGERPSPEVKGEWHRRERDFGKFSRSFNLPRGFATDKVEATFQDGVLSIHLPKAESARPRKIEIR